MRRRPLLLAAVLLALLAGAAGSAYAEEPAPETVPAAAEEEGGISADALDEWIQESPVALWALLLLKYGAAAAGLVLLILLYVRWDRSRAGVLPRPEHRPPTVPFGPLEAFGLVAVFLLGTSLVAPALSEGDDGGGSLVARMVVSQLAFLLPGIIVIVRRQVLRGRGAPSRPAHKAGQALWTFCVASTFVVPALFLTLEILKALEEPITLYGPVEEVVEGGGTATPWIIAFLAIVLAPIGEEAVFRGLLYPALRSEDAPRWRVLLAAVTVSALFALIHFHVASLLPLFVLALVLTWVFERTNSLSVVIGAHALWNASTLIPLLIRGAA